MICRCLISNSNQFVKFRSCYQLFAPPSPGSAHQHEPWRHLSSISRIDSGESTRPWKLLTTETLDRNRRSFSDQQRKVFNHQSWDEFHPWLLVEIHLKRDEETASDTSTFPYSQVLLRFEMGHRRSISGLNGSVAPRCWSVLEVPEGSTHSVDNGRRRSDQSALSWKRVPTCHRIETFSLSEWFVSVDWFAGNEPTSSSSSDSAAVHCLAELNYEMNDTFQFVIPYSLFTHKSWTNSCGSSSLHVSKHSNCSTEDKNNPLILLRWNWAFITLAWHAMLPKPQRQTPKCALWKFVEILISPVGLFCCSPLQQVTMHPLLWKQM